MLFCVMAVERHAPRFIVAQMHGIEQWIVAASHVHSSRSVLHTDALRSGVVELPCHVNIAPGGSVLSASEAGKDEREGGYTPKTEAPGSGLARGCWLTPSGDNAGNWGGRLPRGQF